MTIIGHHQRKGPQLLRSVHRIARIRRQTTGNFRPHLKKRIYIEPELTLPAQMWSSPRFHQSQLLWPRSCRWTKSFPFSFFVPSCGSWHPRLSRHHCPWSQTWVGVLSSAHQDYWTKNTIFLQLKVLREALSIWTPLPYAILRNTWTVPNVILSKLCFSWFSNKVWSDRTQQFGGASKGQHSHHTRANRPIKGISHAL